MKRMAFATILLVLAACASAPGYEAGLAAYERGDFETAIEILRPLADQGDGWAQILLGKAYASGNGVPQDAAE